MHQTLEFPTLLKLIDERQAAFRATIQAAPDLDARVPSCPDWSLLDLARHLGGGQRRWAVIVGAGPDADAPAQSSNEFGQNAPVERAALVEWLAASTPLLLDALRTAGPDRGCWTWWGDSESPQTAGAVARRQVQEAAVHNYDAQLASGVPQPLPVEVAVDGVEEFCITSGTTAVAWPYEAAFIDFHAAEGPSWRTTLNAAGASVSRLPASDSVPEAAAFLRGSASDLVLALYGRIPVDTLEVGGDPKVLERLLTWDF